METAAVWVPLAVAAVTAGPAYIAFVVRKVHHQVNGQDETLSTMTLKTMQAIGRVEAKLDDHILGHGGDGR